MASNLTQSLLGVTAGSELPREKVLKKRGVSPPSARYLSQALTPRQGPAAMPEGTRSQLLGSLPKYLPGTQPSHLHPQPLTYLLQRGAPHCSAGSPRCTYAW